MTKKEFRDFFLRNYQKISGTQPDQEVGFPIDYRVGNTTVKNRFLKNNIPSENVFKKLFESITFKLNREDTAKETEQGLVKLATDIEAKNGSNGIDTFSRSIKPSQLTTAREVITNPISGYDINTILTSPTDIIKVDVDNIILSRNEYKIGIYDNFIIWIKDSFNKIKSYIDTINIINGEVTYPANPLLQNKVNITETLATGSTGKIFKVDVTLPEIPTLNINDIVTQVINQITTIPNTLNVLDILPIGFTTDITSQALLFNEFNLITGLGKPTSIWNKWGIVGIVPGTLDIKGRTLRYLDLLTLDYDTIGKQGGVDNILLNINNLPAHRHTFSFLHRDRNNNYQEWAVKHTASTFGKTTEDGDLLIPIRSVLDTDAGSSDSNDSQYWIGGGNTGNGTENILNQEELSITPTNVNTLNKFTVVAKIVKLS